MTQCGPCDVEAMERFMVAVIDAASRLKATREFQTLLHEELYVRQLPDKRQINDNVENPHYDHMKGRFHLFEAKVEQTINKRQP